MKLNNKIVNFMNHITVCILKFQEQLKTQHANDSND